MSTIARAVAVVGSLYGLLRNRLGLSVATPLGAQELSATIAPDRRLVVLGHEPIAGFTRDHGTVADEAAMLALHTLDGATLLAEPTFVAPGDSCLRTDDPGWRWHCIAGNGTSLADWERRPLAAALDGKQAASVNLTALASIASTTAGRNLLTVATPSGPKLVQVNADGSISLVDASSGGGSATDWEPVEVVDITTAVAGVTLPSNGAFALGYEYRIRFSNWTAAGSGDERELRVDIGGGVISTRSYERHTVSESAGVSAAVYTYGASGSSILSMAAGAAASPVTGEVVFSPGDQSGGKAVFAAAARYADTSGKATLSRSTGALSSPTTSAIQRVYLFAYGVDSTGGNFRLSRRAL